MNLHALCRPGPGMVAFPTPGRGPDILYPELIRPFHGLGYQPHGIARWQDLNLKDGKAIAAIGDASLAATGDLGWTLDYATAWLYRYLERSRPVVSDAIDYLRAFDSIVPQHALYFFDHLDTKLFGGKLKGAVHLRWRLMPSCSPGTTSAPNAIPGIARICIDLNKTPFINGPAQVDNLLEALIHHMIHAYFLICCGVQRKDEPSDDRLMDGLHFGVILMSIVDITKDCLGGKLHMIFHASKRRKIANALFPPHQHPQLPFHLALPNPLPLDPPFLPLTPNDNPLLALPFSTTQTTCLTDNRHITRHAIFVWKITSYTSALSSALSSLKTEKISDYNPTTKEFLEINRIEAPPSSTYVELLYEGKRIMISREKISKLAGLKGLGEELVIPTCDLETFGNIYDFINTDGYTLPPASLLHQRSEAPILLHPTSTLLAPGTILPHVKVFKIAEAMKFEELMKRALEQMSCLGFTSEDPIFLLREIYNDGVIPFPSVHSDLRRWGRRFLARRGEGRLRYAMGVLSRRAQREGLEREKDNLGKILEWHRREVGELYLRNGEFREDVDLVRGRILGGREEGNALRRVRRRRSVERVPRLLAAGLGGELGGGRVHRRRNDLLEFAPVEVLAERVRDLAVLLTDGSDDEIDGLESQLDGTRLLDAPRGHGAGHHPLLAVVAAVDPLGLHHGHGRNILDMEKVVLEI